MTHAASERQIFLITPDRFDKKHDKSTWLEMARYLRELGWQASVVASSASEDPPVFDGLVRYVGSINLPLIFRITTMLAIVAFLTRNSRQGDVILINEDCLPLLPLFRLFTPGRHIHLDIRTVPVEVSGLKKKLNQLLFWKLPIRLLGQRTDSLSFITERLKAAMEAEFATTYAPYCIWQSGVSLEAFTPRPAGARREVTKDAPFTVFYHGTTAPTRGLANVLEAFALDYDFPVQLRIVGKSYGYDELVATAKRLGIEDRVDFCGFVPYEDIDQYVATADVAVCPLPDRPEWNVSSPLKVFEYMACQVPIILTPIPAHLDVLKDCDFVVWSDGSQPQDFRRAIAQAWQERDQLNTAAQSARSYLSGNYEWRDQAAKLDRHLQPLL